MSRNKGGSRVCKGIIIVGIVVVFVGKRWFVGMVGGVFFMLELEIMSGFCGGIVVENELMRVGVGVRWGKEEWGGIVEDGNEVREEEGVGKEVLGSREECGGVGGGVIGVVGVEVGMGLGGFGGGDGS